MTEPLNNTTNAADDEIHLVDCLIVLAKHSRMIICTSMAVTVLAYLSLFCSPNQFTATARLIPPQQNMTMSAQLLDSLGGGVSPREGGGGGLGGMAAGLLGLKSPGELYVAMMKGVTISDHIIAQFNLRELYSAKYIEPARKKLSKNAEIKSGKDGLITIEVTDKDPKRAAKMANAYTEELDKLLQGLAVEEAKERLAFLEKELGQASLKLTKAEEKLRKFSEQNSVVQIDTQTKGMLEYIAILRANIDTKEVQIKVLRQQATPFNYDVIRMETELKGLKEKLHAAESEWDQTCVGDVCLSTSQVPTLGLDYIRLYRQVKFQEGLYQLYTRMVELARVDMVKDVAVVQVVDRAIPPETRSNRRLLPALVVGVAAFFLMVFVVFFQEYIRKAKNKEADAQRLALLWGYLQPYAHGFTKLKNLFRFRRNLT